MANYKDIKGFHVQSLSTDPAVSPIAAGSWASATSMNTGRDAVGSSRGGTQTAHLVFGGQNGTAQQNLTESWNGSAWTEVNELNTARRAGGCFGTQASALFACGVTDASHLISTTAVEKWNGTSWSEIGDMGTSRYSGFNAGPSTSAGIIAAGFMRPGSPPGSPINYYTNTETYNGSTWSEEGEMNVGRYDGCGFGTTEAMIGAGGAGYPPAPGYFAYVESYNGSSWTEINEINTARSKATAAGTSTEGLAAGGNLGPPGATNKTEWFDGTSWSEVSDISTNRSSNDSGGGTATAMIIASGTPDSAVVETFDGVTTPYWIEGQVYYNSSSTNAFKVTQYSFPAGAWSSGGSLSNGPNRNNQGQGNAGTQTSAIAAGGGAPTKIDNTELYDGSSWTEVNELNTARASGGLGAPSSSSGIYAKGASNPTPAGTDLVETWNGTSWSEATESSRAGGQNVALGSASAAISIGGIPTPTNAEVESWNGSAWTEIAELNSGRYAGGGGGTTTDAAFFGGSPEPAGVALTEKYNGTSWTEVGDMNTPKVYNGGAGTSTSALAFAGQSNNPATQIALCESYNGSTWTELADLSTAGNTVGGAGANNTAALCMGGYTRESATEEWNVPLANKTITVS